MGTYLDGEVGIEEAVIACIFLDPEHCDRNIVKPSWFIDDFNRRTFEKTKKVLDKLGKIDLLLAKEEGFLPEELVSIACSFNGVSSTSNFLYYLRAMKLRNLRLQLLTLSKSHKQIDTEELRLLIEEAEHKSLKPVFDISKDLSQYVEYMDNLISGKIKTYSCGLEIIDKFIGRLKEGNLITIGGRPGTGKTSLMLNMAYRIASLGFKCLYLTAEMTVFELIDRLVSFRSGVNSFKLTNGNLEDDEIRNSMEGANEISKLNLCILETSKFNKSEIQELIDRHGFQFIFLDHLQRFQLPQEFETRASAFSEMVSRIKDLALESRKIVFLGSQINRAVDYRPTKEPFMGDLKESGGIEAESDKVLLLWPRDIEVDDALKVTVKVDKNRQGPTGQIDLAFVRRLCEFRPL
jgi:replicative DNA helicase